MARVKGTTLLPRLQFVEEKGGPEARARVLSNLDAKHRLLVEKGVLAASWYPFELFVELVSAIDRTMGNGDLSLVKELGRHSAALVLTKIYPSFYKIGRPEYLFERAATVWNQFYDSGSLEVVKEGERRIFLRVMDFEKPAREHCLSVEGWVEMNIEFAGGINVQVRETRCRTAGEAVCEFLATWD